MQVTLRVLAADGWPVSGAIVTVVDAAGGQAALGAARSDGTIVLDGLGAGTYTAVTTAPGYDPVARTITVNGAAAQPGDITLMTTGSERLPEPGEWRIDPVHSEIRVTAQHLGLSSVHGRFAEFGGTVQIADPPEKTEVAVSIVAASVDTGNGDRDAHLRSADFLAVGEYPEIVFRSSAVARQTAARWMMDGDLTLRGITRPVRLDVRYLGTGPDPWGGTRCAFTASATLRRDDFAVNWNQAVRLGVGVVGATLRVYLDIEAVRQE
ncbi:MAG TPA: YceI family protein [Trebonia sp.]|nr:YceI family protein [Trebonia sp.]